MCSWASPDARSGTRKPPARCAGSHRTWRADDGDEDELMTATTLPTTEVHVAPSGLIHYLKATRTVWWRELILFTKSGPRLAIAFVQPMLFLFVLGTGLSSITGGALEEAGISYRTFAF